MKKKKNKTKKWKQEGVTLNISITKKEHKDLKKLAGKYGIPETFLKGILFSSMLGFAATDPDSTAEILGLDKLKKKYSGYWLQ